MLHLTGIKQRRDLSVSCPTVCLSVCLSECSDTVLMGGGKFYLAPLASAPQTKSW